MVAQLLAHYDMDTSIFLEFFFDDLLEGLQVTDPASELKKDLKDTNHRSQDKPGYDWRDD